MNRSYRILQLDPGQKYFIEKMLTNDCFGIFMRQGTGKTLTVLEALRQMKDRGDFGTVLILSPIICIKNVWEKELTDWSYPFSYHIARDSGLKKVPENRDIYIASNDIVSSKKYAIPLLMVVKPKILIVDESSKYRNYSSKRTRNLINILFSTKRKGRKILEIKRRIKKTYILSGTPRPRHIENLWSQILLLDAGDRLGRNITHFRNQFGLIYNEARHEYVVPPGAETSVYSKIKDIAESRASIYDANILYRDVFCSFSDSEYARYRKFVKDSVLTLPKNERFIATDIAAKTAKLRQLSSGAFYVHDENDDRRIEFFSLCKLQAFSEFIEAQLNEPTLVGYAYTHEAERMIHVLEKLGKTYGWIRGAALHTRDEIIRKWNNKELDVLIGHPAAMAHGLNLQHGGATILWFSPPPSSSFELYDQFNARLNRKGQTKQVIVHHLVNSKSYDPRAYRTVRNKENANKTYLEYIKAEF